MEIKKLNQILMLIMSCLTLSCADKSIANKVQVLERGPAELSSPYANCLANKKKYCLGTFSYDQLERSWWQLEYQFLRDKNELHKKYNQCYRVASIKCSQQFELFELSTKLQNLESSQDISLAIADLKDASIWDDVTIPTIRLAKNAIREIWTHILALKKMYDEIMKTVDVKSTAKNLLHGKGVSITGQAFAGAGLGITNEAIIHNGNLGLFCAPGVYLKSDVGVGIDFNVIQTLGCKSHDHYKGKFFSLELGASAAMFGLPLSAGINYSLGVDVTKYLETLAKKTGTGEFDIVELIKELADLTNDRDELDLENKYAQHYLAFMLAKTLGEKDLSLQFSQNLEYMQKRPMLSEKEYSISYYLKKLLSTYIYDKQELILNKPNFYIALVELNNQLSECDAVSVSAGLSLNIAPVSAGMSLHHYTELTRIDLGDLLYLAKFTPQMLLGLNLPPSEMTRFKTALKNVMSIIPNMNYSQCLLDAGSKFYLDGKNIIKILKRTKNSEVIQLDEENDKEN